MRHALKMVVALLFIVGMLPRGLAAEPKETTRVEGITEYQLDNGLRVLLFPDRSKAVVTVNVTYFVGSRHEGYGETGMAHLLEHMLFKGSVKHPNAWEELEQRGGKSNGTTWTDRTNFFETLPAKSGNLKFAVELEADLMIHSRLAQEDLAREFTVVRNEFEENENSPQEILEERMCSTAYLWHNYGKATIGSRSDIERVPIESLRAFYHRYYQPDNAMLVIAGRFDTTEALSVVQSTFGKIPRPTRKLPETYTVEPVQDGERTAVLRRTGDVGVVGVMYHGMAGSASGFVAEEAIVHLLTHKPTGRLYQALVANGLAADVRGDTYAFAEPTVLEVFADVPAGKPLEPVRDKMVALVESLGKSAISEAEIARFKAAALKKIQLALTDPDRVGIELSDWAAQGDWRLFFVHRDRVKALTAADVQKVAQQYIVSSNRTLGLFIPTKAPVRAPLPEQPKVGPMVAGYKGTDSSESEGEAFEPTPRNIDQRTERLTLPNGMQVALLPKKTRGGAVKMLLSIHAGDATSLAMGPAFVGLVGEAAARGTRRYSFQQIQDKLDSLLTELQFGADGWTMDEPGESMFRLSTIRDSVPEVLALLAEIVQRPAFRKEDVETLRKEKIAGYQRMLQDPSSIAVNDMLRKVRSWPKNDARHWPSFAESVGALKATTAAQVAAFHKNYWGGDAAQLAIVGDFDPVQVKALVTREFGTWRAQHKYQRLELTAQRGAPTDEELLTPDKEMANVGVVQAFSMRDDDPDYPAMRLVDFILGGGFKSRIVERLRTKEGLSYGAWSWLVSSAHDKNSVLFIDAICAPQNAAKAMSSLIDEVSLLVRKGVSAQEIEEAKSRFGEQFETDLAQDDFLVRLLVQYLEADRTMKYYDSLTAGIRALTPTSLAAVVTKYLDPDRLVRVRAGDLHRRAQAAVSAEPKADDGKAN
jgi:zinc protease